jgi:Domain of unknown function (DUF1735)
MNFTNKISIVLLTLGVAGLSSCLKDAKSNSDASLGTNNVVEFQNSSVPISYSSIYPQYDNSLIFSPDTSGFNVNFNWAGAQLNAPQDITITVALDTAALSAFDANQSQGYALPPADVYSIPSFTATIAKGSNYARIRITITNAADFDFNAQYAIPLTITASSYGTAIYSFSGRNQYDGAYSMDMQMIGWGAYGISDGPTYTWPTNVSMVTNGPSAVIIETTQENTYQPAFVTGGGTTGFGATETEFNFDPSSNALTSVVNLQPNDGRGRAFALNPAVTTSRYDPTAKVIYAAYTMVQNGRPTQYIYDTLTYQGPRP